MAANNKGNTFYDLKLSLVKTIDLIYFHTIAYYDERYPSNQYQWCHIIVAYWIDYCFTQWNHSDVDDRQDIANICVVVWTFLSPSMLNKLLHWPSSVCVNKSTNWLVSQLKSLGIIKRIIWPPRVSHNRFPHILYGTLYMNDVHIILYNQPHPASEQTTFF